MSALFQDLRHSLRALARSPGFTAPAVLTLALGIGANTAIFSVVYGVLVRPLPYPDPGRIVELSELDGAGRRMRLADPNFRDLKEQNRSFAALSEWTSIPTSISGGSEPVRVIETWASRDFFAVLGAQPMLGRAFAAEELRTGGPPVVLVSHSFWERFLSGERDLSRLNLRFDGDLYRVVGVMAPGFQFPEGSQLWTARERRGPEDSRSAHNWHALGRLGAGVSLAAARADVRAIAERIKREHGQDADLVGAAIVPLKDALVGRVLPALLLLLAAVGFLMLVAGANVTNLALARTAARRREMAVRAALGASRVDLLRVLFAETLLVALAGGAAGVLLSLWSLGAIRTLSGPSLPRAAAIALDLPVLGFAIALSVVSAFAIAAAASRRPAEARLKDLAGARGAGPSAEASRAQGILLGVQAAIAALLLAGLALFTRSFLAVLAVEPGFRTEGVLAIDLFPPYLKVQGLAAVATGTPVDNDAEKARRVELIDRLLTRLSSIPGVERAGAVGSLPLGSDMADGTFLLNGGEPVPQTIPEFERLMRDPDRTGRASYCPVTGGYFKAMGIPLLRGRLFDERDGPDAPHVALISAALARQTFANRDPIGQKIEFGNMDGDMRLLTVVGVVGNVRSESLEAPPDRLVYVNFRQRPQAAFALTTVLRIKGNPATVAAAARAVIRDIDPTLPPRFRPLDEIVSNSLAARRFSLTLLAFFGALALSLAAAGIASVTAFAVARRRPELGIRLALGAKPSDLFRILISRHVRIIAAGTGVGLAAAALLARLLKSQLYGVPPLDPWSFAASTVLLLSIGLLACAGPARQASRIDPTEALRSE
jgi:putative ABC transport system permease protein